MGGVKAIEILVAQNVISKGRSLPGVECVPCGGRLFEISPKQHHKFGPDQTKVNVNAHSAIQLCVCQACKNLQHPEMLAQRPNVPAQRPKVQVQKPDILARYTHWNHLLFAQNGQDDPKEP
jgi:hypothetical protein